MILLVFLFLISIFHSANRFFKIGIGWVLIFFLSSCIAGGEQEQQLLEQDVREFDLKTAIDGGNGKKKDIGEHLKMKESVILEFNEDYPIQNIHKIVVQEPYILILDNVQNYLYLYDDQGEFIRQIGSLGNGPGEYLDMTDFEISGKEIIVFSNASRKILHFNITGSFIKEIPIIFHGASVVPIDSNYLLWTQNNVSPQIPYDLILMNSSGEMIRGEQKLNPGFPSITSSGFLVRNAVPGNIRYLKMFGHEIYGVDENLNMVPFYRINLGATGIDLQKNVNIENFLFSFHEKTFLSDMYWENSSLILLYFHHDLRRNFGLIPKSDWQMHTESWYEDHAILDILRSIKTGYMTEENLYICSNPGYYQSESSFELIDSMTLWNASVISLEAKKELIENSNGVIFKFSVL